MLGISRFIGFRWGADSVAFLSLPSHILAFLTPQSYSDHIFHDPTITVNTMAACAAYAAVLRYVTRGRDEYPIAPRNIPELRAVLCVQCLLFLGISETDRSLFSSFIFSLTAVVSDWDVWRVP